MATDGEIGWISINRIPIIADRSMPVGCFQIRSGDQRMTVWLDKTDHDPGDEDRSER